jgi:sporulation protein YlmC with PRC-barrel domain
MLEPQLLSLSILKGTQLVDRAGSALGQLEDVIVDAELGQVSYAVVSLHHLAGQADRMYVVPWQSVLFDSTRGRFRLLIEPDELQLAPALSGARWRGAGITAPSGFECFRIRSSWQTHPAGVEKTAGLP